MVVVPTWNQENRQGSRWHYRVHSVSRWLTATVLQERLESSSPAVRKVSSWLEHGLHQSRSTYPLHCPIRVDDAATVEIACASSGEATDFH